MANNKPVGNAVHTRPVEVSQQLQDGEKFIKWDEVSTAPSTLACFIQQSPLALVLCVYVCTHISSHRPLKAQLVQCAESSF